MFSRFFDRWGKSASLTSGELAVLRALLPTGNLYSELLYAQASHSPMIERRLIETNGYEAVIPYILDNSLLIECEVNVESPSLRVRLETGGVLLFSTTILRGGFLRGLKGITADGQPWPKQWNPDMRDLMLPGEMRNWIPVPISSEARIEIIKALVTWCGLERAEIGCHQLNELRIAKPATKIEIESCERRLGKTLGPQYRELLEITNGFGVCHGRPYEILGTNDIEFVGVTRDWLGVTPLYEDGYVAFKSEGGFVTDTCYLLTLESDQRIIGDLKRHIRDSLSWK